MKSMEVAGTVMAFVMIRDKASATGFSQPLT